MSARRLNPDRPAMLVAVVLFGALIAAASFTLSFAGLRDVAEWGGADAWLRPLVPLMIDAALLTYTLSWLIQRARGESTWLSWCSLFLFTVVSLLGNSLHGWQPSLEVQRIVGTAVVGLAPLALLLATHTLAQLLTERAPLPAATDTAPVARVVDLNAARKLAGPVPAGNELMRLQVRHARRTPARAGRAGRATPPALAAKVRELRDVEGHTFEEIGKRIGMSKSRAHAIYQEAAAA